MSELPELVSLLVIFPSLHIDLKYATADSVTGTPIYREVRCLLRTEMITILAKSISIAWPAGLQLMVYGTYCPQQAQVILRNAYPDPQYVVDVAIGSNHGRGTAIDVTLVDDHSHPPDMDAGFDEMHGRSHAWHPSVPPAAQHNRLLLNAIMFGGGLVGINSGWWHFELPDAVRYPLPDDQIDCYTVIPTTTQHSP